MEEQVSQDRVEVQVASQSNTLEPAKFGNDASNGLRHSKQSPDIYLITFT
jgi:hypothetical protein